MIEADPLYELWQRIITEKERNIWRERAKNSLAAVYGQGFSDEEIAFQLWKQENYG